MLQSRTHTHQPINCVELRVCRRDSRKSNDDNCSSDLVIIDTTPLEVYQQQQQELLLWSNQSHQQSSLCAIVALLWWVKTMKTLELKRRFGFSCGPSSSSKESQMLANLWISKGTHLSPWRKTKKQCDINVSCYYFNRCVSIGFGLRNRTFFFCIPRTHTLGRRSVQFSSPWLRTTRRLGN